MKEEYINKINKLIPLSFYQDKSLLKCDVRKHPLKEIIEYINKSSENKLSGKYKNIEKTIEAIFQVSEKFPDWFEWKWENEVIQIKKDQFVGAVSTLSEIRTLKKLSDLPVQVNPLKENSNSNTPDFKVKTEDTIFYVEAYTPMIKKEAKEKLENFRREIKEKNKSKKLGEIEVNLVSYNPIFEGWENIDEIIEKIEQRALGKKHKAKQTIPRSCNILWVDLMSNEWGTLGKEITLPYVSKEFKDMYATGNFGVWAAFYGKKGMKLFKDRTWLSFANETSFRLKKQDGYFRQKGSWWSAVAFSFYNGTVVYQNPWALNPLNEKVVELLIRVWDFDLFCSWIDINNSKLITKINFLIEEIEDIYRMVCEAQNTSN